MADNKEMSLSKVSSKPAIPYNTKLINPAAKAKAFTESNVIVLTVNPDLDNVASPEKLNAKAEAAKQMFANYRNKK